MLYIFSVILVLLNLLYGFSKKQNKFILFTLILLAWIIFWGSYINPDYDVYLSIYNSNGEYTTNSLEYGFILLIKIFNLLGFNYEMFLMTVSIVAFCLIHTTVKRFVVNYHYVYAFYFVFPFFMDVVQIRNFLMMAIFIYATKFLVEDKKIKYLICIIIASSLQISAFAFLPFILINNKGKNYIVQVVFFISISTSIILLLNNKEIPFLGNIIDFTQSDKLSFYFETTTNYGFLLYWFLQVVSFVLISLSRQLYKKYCNVNLKDDLKMKYINLVYWINVVAFAYLPLYLLNSNFSRLMRNLVILNYIVIAITSYVIKNKEENRIYILIVLVYIVILFGILQIPFFNDTIKPILENNIII